MSIARPEDLKELKLQVQAVLEKHEQSRRCEKVAACTNEPGIKLNHFWTHFTGLHHVLPDHKKFGKSKRSDLLTLCPDVCQVIEGPGNERFVIKCRKQPSGIDAGIKSNKKKKKSQSPDNTISDMAERSRQQRHPSGPYAQGRGGSGAVGGNVYSRFYSSGHNESSDFESSSAGTPEMQSSPHMPHTVASRGLTGWFGNNRAQITQPHDIGHFPEMRHWPGSGGNPGNQRSYQDRFVPPRGISPHSSRRQHGYSATRIQVPKEQLKSVAEDCIDRLSEAQEYVSPERVEQLILQHYQVECLEAIGVSRLESISVLNEHLRVQCKVNAYIKAFIKVHSIATLCELADNLKDYVPDKQDFDKLKLGPLVKQPLVYEFFKVPQDATILEIRTVDILEHLRNYLSEKNMWTARLEANHFEEFMNYMVGKYEVENAYELGVRIRSLPLAVGVLKKAQRECGQTVRAVIATYRETTERDVALAFRTFTSSLIQKEAGICTVRQQYCRQSAAKVTGDVFAKLNVLFVSLLYIMETHATPKHIVKQLSRQRDAISQFMTRFSDDKMAQQLFQVAVCCGMEPLHTQLQDLMGWGAQQEDPTGESQDLKVLPAQGDIEALTLKYLERCVVHGSLSLAHLARIENKILEDLHFADFTQLGHGTFLDFLGKKDAVKKFLEDCGGSLVGMGTGSKSAGGMDSVYHPSLHDLLDFIRQTGLTESEQAGELQTVICGHYCVTDVRALGHGTVAHLLTSLERQRRQAHEPTVYYQAALCSKTRLIWSGGSRQVGLMGHQSRENALACLQRCPLLENLAEWSQWEHVFRPELGDLKEFLQKYGGIHHTNMPAKSTDSAKVTMTTNILALEVIPGVLLKVTRDTSPEKFATAALEADVSLTCGHLVSLVVSNKGLDNTPLALLGNHIKTSLIKMHASEMEDDIPGAPSSGRQGGSGVVQFVLECLSTLPVVICQAVANQVFLEPLSHVVGASKSKDILAQQAMRSSRHRGRIQLLGWVLGVAEWSHSFQDQVEPPSDSLHKMESQIDPILEDEVIEIDSESDSSSEEDSQEEFSLSDDGDDDDEIKIIKVQPGDVVEVKVEPKVVNEVQDVKNEDISDKNTEALPEEPEVVQPKEADTINDLTIEDPCKALIEHIRSEEFGIDIILSEDGQKLMQKQQERLGRSLDRLSRDLYSKDTHFVLELIQNADDNDYLPDILQGYGASGPAVKFLVEEDAITVLNNEVGFKERNIRAICDVGRSTKGKHKFGYIGQKGIGFKSVFRVTDQPEIHSNGFHICFDVNSGPMGYILPHWVPQTQDKECFNSWTTRIVLTLKSSLCSQGEARSLAARFQDIHPSLLLFLHRLRAVAVDNKVEGYSLEMTRRDVGDHLVEISHTNGTDHWLVIKKTLDASHISVQAKSGVEVESTEIALAFPLQDQERIKAQVLPQKQPVFAFLPLRSYGFRFVIQGDFDVPSSREDVDKDSMWNQWLRSEIHTLFVEALEMFKSHDGFSGLEAVCSFLQFVPLEDEVLDFFRPVASHILQQLRARPCLPAQSRPGAGVEWKLPSQLLISPDPLVREVISPQMLHKHLCLSYLHDDVAAVLNQSLMRSLGVQSLTTQHLIEMGKVLVHGLGSATQKNVEKSLPSLAKWLTCVYHSMDEFHPDSDVLEVLRSLPMIPLADGSFCSLRQRTVFFPLSAEEKKKYSSSRDPLSELERDLHTIHPKLMNGADDIANSQVRRLLEQLGVKQLTPADIIHHHILPCLKSGQSKNKSQDLLVGFLIYIKEALDRQPSLVNMEELCPIAVLLTSHGMRQLSSGSIHFTPAYGNRLDLRADLPGYDWVLIDNCYLRPGAPPKEVHSWREFLAKLGVLDFLSVQSDTITIAKGEMGNSPWVEYEELVPEAEGYKVVDWRCIEFASLVAENSEPNTERTQMQLLLQLIDRDWDSNYSRYTMTQITDLEGHTLKEVPTSFAMLLKGVSWIPSIRLSLDDGTSGAGRLVEKAELEEGSELFVRVPAIEKLLAHHVSYLDAQLSVQSSFSKFLGIRTSVTTEFICEQLKEWCCRDDDDNDDIPVVFYTSMVHMKSVYSYLADNLPPRQLQDLLHENPFIFFPSIAGRSISQDELVVPGRFLSRQEVWWMDTSGLFGKFHSEESTSHLINNFRETISSIYADMQDFFLRCARVQKGPQLGEYIQLLMILASSKTVQQVLGDVLVLLSTLGAEVLAAQQNSSPEGDLLLKKIKELPSVLASAAVFPCKSGKWVGLTAKPMVVDDRQLERLFQGKAGVHFLDVGDQLHGPGRRRHMPRAEPVGGISQVAIRAFLHQCGVGLLSECIQIDYTTELYQPCPLLQKYVHDVLLYVQLLLFSEHPDVYERLNTAGIPQKLPTMQFGVVGKLELVYSLKEKPSVVVALSEPCRITDTNQFYVLQGHVEAYNDLNKELARFFSMGNQACQREIRNFLLELLPLVQKASPELESFMREHELGSLPKDEPVWHIPEPVIIPPAPPSPSPGNQIPTSPRPLSLEETSWYAGEMSGRNSPFMPAEGSTSDSGEVKSGLTSWPPRAGSGGPTQQGGPKTRTGIWPPPAPPKYMDTRELPAGLRPSRVPKDAGDTQQQVPSGGDHQKQELTGEGHAARPHDPTSENSQLSPRGGSADGNKGPGHGSGDRPSSSTGGESMMRPPDHYGNQSGTSKSPQSDGGRGQHSGHGGTSEGQEGEIIESHGDHATEQLSTDVRRSRMGAEEHRRQDGLNMTSKKRPREDSEGSQQGGAPTPKRAPTGHYDLPEWTREAAELIYEELPFGAGLELPSDMSVGDQEKEFKVGLWGEQLVHSYLCQQMALPGSDVVEVTWVNQEKESNKPYDLVVQMKDIYGKGHIETVYIEVKSTEFNEKTFFEISAQEVRFAQEKQQYFHLYRVFNAGKKAVRLTKLENLSQKMDYQQVRLCMLV